MNGTSPTSDESADPSEPAKSIKQPRRRLWILVGCVVAVLAIVAGTAVAMSIDSDGKPKPDDADGVPAHCKESPKQTGITEPEDVPEDGGIEVVETGSSTSEDLAELGEDDGLAGFGAELKNTSELAARNVEVTLTASWPDGSRVRGDQKGRPWEYGPLNFGSFSPGQEFGLGFVLYIKNERQSDNPDLKLNVKTTVGEWWDPANDVHEFASLNAEFDRVESGGRLRYTVDSQYCEKVSEARVGLVYRNSKGDIVGGWAELDMLRGKSGANVDRDDLPAFPPGRTEHVSTDDMWGARTIDDEEFSSVAELSKTDVFPYLEPSAED